MWLTTKTGCDAGGGEDGNSVLGSMVEKQRLERRRLYPSSPELKVSASVKCSLTFIPLRWWVMVLVEDEEVGVSSLMKKKTPTPSPSLLRGDD